ncbi:MAG TPA: GNAT family N-acetyltransferase [Polyangiaceae bacterium]|nr:GNAT family N-acetyltransferase [Polyangiaceae bacterium]
MDLEQGTVRPLGPEDAPAFRAVRLRALETDPASFLSSYEEEAPRSMEEFAARLRGEDPAVRVVGAFRGHALVGTLGFYRHAPLKARHRASLWGMYVAPEERRRGVGRALVDEALRLLRAVGTVEQAELNVAVVAEAARRLYASVGFEAQGVLRGAMKIGGRYFDEEMMVLRWQVGGRP